MTRKGERGQMTNPEEVLSFWIDETGPQGWYKASAALDDAIRKKFGLLWQQAGTAATTCWSSSPRGMLALLVLLDQFPRNMFRGSGKSFSTDADARAKAKKAIRLGWDLRIDGEARQFFYLPLMHSECLEDQERAVRLLQCRLPGSKDNLLHARAHREVIRRFGRFPHRNHDLGRRSTPAELAFLGEGGYSKVVDSLSEAA